MSPKYEAPLLLSAVLWYLQYPFLLSFPAKLLSVCGAVGLGKRELWWGRRLHTPGLGRLGERMRYVVSRAGEGCISTVCHQLVPQPGILRVVDLHLPRELIRRLVEKSTRMHAVLVQLTLVPQSESFLVF